MRGSTRYVLCAGVGDDVGQTLAARLAGTPIRLEFVRTAADFLLMARSVRFDLFVLAGEFADGGAAGYYGQVRKLNRNAPVLFLSHDDRAAQSERELPAGERAYFVNHSADELARALTRLLR